MNKISPRFPDKLKPGQGVIGQAARAERAEQLEQQKALVQGLRATVDELRVGLQQSVNGIALIASQAFPVTPGKSPFRVAASTVRLIGWSLENTTTTPVVVRFRAVTSEGDITTADIVASVRLDGGATSSPRVGTTGGVQAEGLALEIVPVAGAGAAFAGGIIPAIVGSVHIGRVD